MKKFIALFILVTTVTFVNAQTVDEILNNYFENTGGLEKWKALKGTKSTAKVDAQGMTIPLEIYNMSDGKSLVKFELQGKEMVQGAFDGETSWGVNFMTMKPEKSDDETTENVKRSAGDYPSPFIDYKEKGYKVELMGEETVEGVECYKIKLTKKPMLVEGQEVDNIEYYYFDKENFVPILSESEIPSGPMKGQIAQTVYSDYQEVEGLYFPFSITSKMKDGQGQTVQIESVELNPEVDESMFKFPEGETTE
ncbi:MAG: hypothetical protein Kow0079_14870 [Vicingaceae bacterium]